MLQQTVYHHKMYVNRLLGSAKPGDIEPSDWSAAKNADDGYWGKSCPCWISSELTVWADYRYCYFHCLF